MAHPWKCSKSGWMRGHLVRDVPALGSGAELDDLWRSHPTQIILWFFRLPRSPIKVALCLSVYLYSRNSIVLQKCCEDKHNETSRHHKDMLISKRSKVKMKIYRTKPYFWKKYDFSLYNHFLESRRKKKTHCLTKWKSHIIFLFL